MVETVKAIDPHLVFAVSYYSNISQSAPVVQRQGWRAPAREEVGGARTRRQRMRGNRDPCREQERSAERTEDFASSTVPHRVRLLAR